MRRTVGTWAAAEEMLTEFDVHLGAFPRPAGSAVDCGQVSRGQRGSGRASGPRSAVRFARPSDRLRPSRGARAAGGQRERSWVGAHTVPPAKAGKGFVQRNSCITGLEFGQGFANG